MDSAYQRALDTLQAHREGLTRLAELLLEREVIFAEDLEKIFGKRKGELRKEMEIEVDESFDETRTVTERKRGQKSPDSDAQRGGDAGSGAGGGARFPVLDGPFVHRSCCRIDA